MEAIMSANKHLKTGKPTDADLAGNPGIGSSKGMGMAGGEKRARGTPMGGADPGEIEGDATFEGDVENETNAQGGVDPAHIGRANR
jgi:hypothetical protein